MFQLIFHRLPETGQEKSYVKCDICSSLKLRILLKDKQDYGHSLLRIAIPDSI